MKVFKILILLSLGMIAFQAIAAEGADSIKKQEVYINGNIEGKSFSELGIEADVFSHYFRSRRALDATTLDSGSSKHLISDSIVWVNLIIPKKSLPKNASTQWFFVLPGDSVELNIIGKEPNATGRGSNRINCLWAINNINWDYYLKEDVSREKDYFEKINLMILDAAGLEDSIQYYYNQYLRSFQVIDYLYNLKCRKLAEWKNKLAAEEYAYIKLECDLWRNIEMMDNWFYIDGMTNAEKIARKQAFDKYIAKLDIDMELSINFFRSLNYANYASRLELLKLYYGKDLPHTPTFPEIVDTISSKYSGELYEKIMTAVVAGSSQYSFKLSETDINSITVNNKIFNAILESYRLNLNQELNISSFALTDERGRQVYFKDFKNKVLVLDFWFTGCTNCLKLTDAMIPIVERFKQDQNVLFVSINMDKSREKWLNSLKYGAPKIALGLSGKYSHPESINLSAYPTGFRNELAKALNIMSAPQLMIIDKKGDVVSRHPPRPLSKGDSNSDALINLIRRYKDDSGSFQ